MKYVHRTWTCNASDCYVVTANEAFAKQHANDPNHPGHTLTETKWTNVLPAA